MPWTGPIRQRSNSPSTSSAGALADDDVEPVALRDLGRASGQQRLVVAHDHVDERVAWQAELVDQAADEGVAGADGELEHLGAETADRADLHQRAGGSPARAS